MAREPKEQEERSSFRNERIRERERENGSGPGRGRSELEERTNRARESAREAIDEERLEEVLRAAGAREVTEPAKRALRALSEEAIARYAIEAVQISRERKESEVSEESIACAAAVSSRQ